jgi:hypothetical protein
VLAAMSWHDWVQLIAAVVAALAAAVAINFAWLTVREARELRREDRRARLGELVGDYSASLLMSMNGRLESRVKVPVTRARLAAAVASAEEPLPACEALPGLDDSSSPAVVREQTELAVDELAG